MKSQKIWDAIVVGSGATGGAAAHKLAARGLEVLVLEAGPAVSERKHYGSPLSNVTRQLYRHYVSKRQSIQEMHATYWTTNPDFFVDDIDHPYTTPEGMPFRWIRGRQLGGRSLVWDGVTPRFSDHEFLAASRDGVGIDWPIRHADLAPHYAELERMFGVHGSAEGLDELPDGDFLEPRPLTSAETVFRHRVEKKFAGRHVLPSRGIRAGRRPSSTEAHSRLSSQATSLVQAMATGRVTVRTGAVVARVAFHADASGARGVEFVDATTGRSEDARAKMVFLCASTIETVRILLSSTDGHPGGLGASSGVLGHYLMDHIASNIYFYLPDVPDRGEEHELLGSDSILIPRHENLNGTNAGHLRGFGFWGGISRLQIPTFLRRRAGEAFGFLCARSEVLPHFDNCISLDPQVRDAWGLPAPHIACEWKEEDLKIAAAARRSALEMIDGAGGVVSALGDLVHTPVIGGFLEKMQAEWRRSTPGLFVHEVGGARMGEKPTDSVVNRFNQVWEAPNVFVVDGACWPSCGWQNPTLTEMAITLRAADFAAQELAEGRL
ncbi:MAG TPA: GMC family oxidoreductase [Polyangiaceae bacterium]|nr:GMC family oxidoreductase [Polyangiaceae bacterium]